MAENEGATTHSQKEPFLKIELPLIIFGALMFGVVITFAITLAMVTAPQFEPGTPNPNAIGIADIIFAVVIGVFAAGFMYWLKSFMTTQPYLGLIIGIITLGAFAYSLSLKYQGPYTTAYTVTGSLIVLAYLLFYFYASKKKIQRKGHRQIVTKRI